ncbi:MAG: hypothetical protein J5952_09860 [Prevotella sp.]|nr:hypothetical protein [Prevotella sp.]
MAEAKHSSQLKTVSRNLSGKNDKGMAKMLICPKCGLYQEDTTGIRKAGVAAKKAALFAGHHTMKWGTKALAASIGLDGDYTQRAAGIAGSELANAIGLNPDNASISDVKYKCSSCSHYWVGQDNPSYYNQIQLNTVKKEHELRTEEMKTSYKKSLKGILYAAIFVGLSFWIWSERSAVDVTNSFLGFTSTSTNYSWHYYLFWPMVIISGFWFVIKIMDAYSNYQFYEALRDISDVEFAKGYMGLGT